MRHYTYSSRGGRNLFPPSAATVDVSEQLFTIYHVVGAWALGMGAGLLAGYLAAKRGRERQVVLYVPEGFELSPAPPEAVDLAVWRTRKVVAGV